VTAESPIVHRRGFVRVAGTVLAFAALSCSRHLSNDVEVEVSRIAVDPEAHAPVILLEDKAHTTALPIWIGPAEAQAIASRLEGIEPARPLTHDLLKSVMDRVGMSLQRVVIRELRDDTYYATLVLLWEGNEVEMDSRPSDAIALAVRFGQPIYVNRALLESRAAVALGGDSAAPKTVGGVTVQTLSAALADYFAVPAGQGVIVAGVDGAATALQRGDVVLEIDGTPVRNAGDFAAKVRARRSGADLAVQRDGARIHVAFAPAGDDATD
jgi:bifunctional DNase/RNase